MKKGKGVQTELISPFKTTTLQQQTTKRTTVNNNVEVTEEEVVHVNFVAAIPLILTIVAMGDHNCHMYVHV